MLFFAFSANTFLVLLSDELKSIIYCFIGLTPGHDRHQTLWRFKANFLRFISLIFLFYRSPYFLLHSILYYRDVFRVYIIESFFVKKPSNILVIYRVTNFFFIYYFNPRFLVYSCFILPIMHIFFISFRAQKTIFNFNNYALRPHLAFLYLVLSGLNATPRSLTKHFYYRLILFCVILHILFSLSLNLY